MVLLFYHCLFWSGSAGVCVRESVRAWEGIFAFEGVLGREEGWMTGFIGWGS